MSRLSETRTLEHIIPDPTRFSFTEGFSAFLETMSQTCQRIRLSMLGQRVNFSPVLLKSHPYYLQNVLLVSADEK